jgi:hypothetical protein
MAKFSSIALRFGILFTVLGFGSLILEQFNYEFTLISWADDMQPVFGIVLGLVGVAIIVVPLLLARRVAAAQPKFAPQPPQAPAPAPSPQQQPGQPS